MADTVPEAKRTVEDESVDKAEDGGAAKPGAGVECSTEADDRDLRVKDSVLLEAGEIRVPGDEDDCAAGFSALDDGLVFPDNTEDGGAAKPVAGVECSTEADDRDLRVQDSVLLEAGEIRVPGDEDDCAAGFSALDDGLVFPDTVFVSYMEAKAGCAAEVLLL